MFFVLINIEKFEIRHCKNFGMFFVITKFKCVIFWSRVRLGLSKPVTIFLDVLFE